MKKGFTLVELLGVIVILGIIGVITTPLIINAVNNSKENANTIQEQIIKRAAKNYVQANMYTFDKDCDVTGSDASNKCIVTIKKLQEEGYLEEKELKNVKEDKIIDPEKSNVEIKKENKQYTYTPNITYQEK